MLWSIRLQCQTWLRNWTTKFILSPPLSFYILLFNILFWNNYQFTRSYKDSTERTEVSFTQFSMVTSYIIKVQYQKHWHWYNMSIVFCLFSVIAYWIHLTTTEIKIKTILSHEYLTYITSLESYLLSS